MQFGKHWQLGFLTAAYLISLNPVFSADSNSKDEPLKQAVKISVTAVEAQGRRQKMEDTHVYGEEDGIFYAAVYDGHGGKQVSTLLTNEETSLHKLILKKIASNHTVEESLMLAYQHTDKLISSLGGVAQCGATAVNAIIKDNILYVANIGDAEAMVFTETIDESPIVLSEIHKPTMPSEKERITKMFGQVAITHDRLFGTLAVSRAFGDFKFKKPQACEDFVLCAPFIKSLPIKPEHRYVVVTCDGLTEQLTHMNIANFIRTRAQEGLHIEAIAKELLEMALEQSYDNITFVLIKFGTKSS